VCDTGLIKGSEFLRKVQRIAKAKDVTCVFVPGRGKGSHGTLYFGSRLTVLKDRRKEIGPGLLRAMCKDLGIEPKDL
jgi:mRNA interferase HicA